MPLQHAGLAAIYGADFRKNPEQFDPDLARQIERGLSWRGVEVATALGASSAIKAAFGAFFGEFDLLLAPTVPCVAWPLTRLGPEMIGGRQASPRGHAVFTPFVNHAGLPAISIPCGRDATGLSFGLQIIARRRPQTDKLSAIFCSVGERIPFYSHLVSRELTRSGSFPKVIPLQSMLTISGH